MRLQCLEAAAGPPGVVTGASLCVQGEERAGEVPCGLPQGREQTEQRRVSAFSGSLEDTFYRKFLF